MSQKDVNDYLTEGIYGVRLPKEDEREYFLGTLRERIVIALTVGQVMSDKGLSFLEQAMKEHPETKLLMNGHVAGKFLKEEKEVANKYNIPYSIIYSIISSQENKTDIGAVLAYDYAIHKEDIFMKENEESNDEATNKENDSAFLSKVKKWFGYDS
jgi:uncharacterized protein YueI